MKNWKKSVFFGVVAIIALGFALIGCDNGDEKTKEFTVTFDLDGGNIGGDTASVKITVKSGEKIANLPDPKKTGYILGGWFAEKNETVNEFTSATAVTADVTVFAKWNEEQPIEKTYTIEFKDGALKFDVKYMALPSDEEPAFLTYLKTRLGVVVNNNTEEDIMETVADLMDKGSRFTITIVPGTTVGMTWDTETQSFIIHNDWIFTASGTNLSGSMIQNAFNRVVIE
jgi:uncharacterized repeat protein (TIGR02543 family)